MSPSEGTLDGDVDAAFLDTGALEAEPDSMELAAFASLAEQLAPASSPRLEPGTVLAESFEIEEVIGSGGMGVVYRARDLKLGRPVALKLHRGVTKGTERLMREAASMAKLTHPNVATVHEVGTHEGMLFIAMELVDGVTIRRWVSQDERTPAQIVAMYHAAGLGLAAAHRAGLVHRDFKPDNVLVGSDDVPRVVDFGLARAVTDVPLTVTPDPAQELSHSGTLTETGAVVGTPAYMAPEQFEGGEIDERADQFSFCVALYEAVYGERPFTGRSVVQLLSAMAQGAIQPPPAGTRVSARLRRALVRGLATRPDERWPSMDELLTELGRDPARARRRALTAAAFVGLASTAIYAFASQAPPRTAADLCQIAEDEVADVWNGDRRTAVTEAFAASDRPYAQKVGPQVETALDRYAESWALMRERACIDHERGGDSSEVYDRRVTCLSRRERALDRGITKVTEIAAASPERAIDIVRGLPRVEDCGDAAVLRSELPPPADPSTAHAVEQQRERIDEVDVLWNAGEGAEAHALAEQIAEQARALDYPPLLAEAQLTLGRTAMKTDRQKSAAASTLMLAALTAWETRQDGVALEAVARYIYVTGTSIEGRSADGDEFAADLAMLMRIAEAQASGAPDHRFARALLYNNLASAQRAMRRVEKARAYYRKALDEFAGASNTPPELDHVFSNLAQITADPAERSRLFEQAMQRFDAAYGPEHPEALAVRLDYSHYLTDPAQVRELLEPVCTTYERYHPELISQLHLCLGRLAFVIAEGGEPAVAAQVLDRVASTQQDAAGLDDRPRGLRISAQLLEGRAHVYRGDHAEAIAPLRWVTQNISEDLWWEQFTLGQAALGLGESLRLEGEPHDAVIELERAVAAFDDYCAGSVNFHVKGQQWRAAAQMALAAALIEEPGEDGDRRQRAAQMVARAEEFYRSAGDGYRWRRDELKRWRREHGL